jgi:hypothetical protein
MPAQYSYFAQGSQEWIQARLGIPTASSFDRILTPKGKLSEQSQKYCFELIAERLTGIVSQGPNLAIMQRGHDLEEYAASYYEIAYGVETELVGFALDKSGKRGASPDRLVGEKGLLEVKCPLPATHVSYLILNSVDDAYKPQLQGQLLVCDERDWVDIVSYHPAMPMGVVRVERNEGYQILLREALEEFSHKLEKYIDTMKERDYWHPPVVSEPEQKDYSEQYITDADIAAILGDKA